MMQKIFVRLQSGLGNQLFHYAFAKVLSLNTKNTILLDASNYRFKKGVGARNLEIQHFDISIPIITSKFCIISELKSLYLSLYINKFRNERFYNTKQYSKISFTKSSQILFAPHYHFKDIQDMANHIDNVRYILKERFWLYKDFVSIREVLLKELQFQPYLNEKNKEYLQHIIQSESVGVHIRRGDFLTSDYPINLFETKYYKNSFSFIRNKIKNPRFFIFSDDKDFIAKNFRDKDCVIVDGNSDDNILIDFFLMRNCKHFIMANSTLSWWVAFLHGEDSIIISPKRWRNSDLQDVSYDYIPESYKRIDL